MKSTVLKRIENLQSELQKAELDAALLYDRENLIYFTGLTDLEGCALCVPAQAQPTLFCIAQDAEHIRAQLGSEIVVPYRFPQTNVSIEAANWLRKLNPGAPRVGFTRYFISLQDYLCLRKAVPEMVVSDIATLCYKLRSVKDADEIRRIRQAGEFLKLGMQAAIQSVAPGVTETEVLAEADYAMRKAGSEGSTFRMQVLTKSRQLQIHPYAGAFPLEDDGPVVIHLGASCEGYAAKMCRTVFLGNASAESRRIYEMLHLAQREAAEACRPGSTCAQVYDAALRVVAEYGYEKTWLDHIGYGVGIRQSEFYPIIAKNNPTCLCENMVVDLLLPTVYRKDGGGPRLTDTILIGTDGPEFLTG